MRLGLVVGTVILAATGSVAAASDPDRSVGVQGTIAQLSSASLPLPANQHAAFLTQGRCPKVGVWRLTNVVQKFDSHACSRTYGLSLTDLSARWATASKTASGTRYALWRSLAGVRRTRDPYSDPRPVVRRTVAPGESAPFVLYDGTYWTNGRLAGLDSVALDAPPESSVYDRGRSMGVLDAAGTVSVYSIHPGPRDPVRVRVQYEPGEVLALKSDPGSAQYLVLVQGRLDVLSEVASKTAPWFSVRLPAADSYGDDSCYKPSCPVADLRLADFDWPYAVYVRGQAIHLIHLRTLKDLVVRRPLESPVHAQLEPGGLTYSHDNKISYFGRKKIDALFRP